MRSILTYLPTSQRSLADLRPRCRKKCSLPGVCVRCCRGGRGNSGQSKKIVLLGVLLGRKEIHIANSCSRARPSLRMGSGIRSYYSAPVFVAKSMVMRYYVITARLSQAASRLMFMVVNDTLYHKAVQSTGCGLNKTHFT